MHPIPLAPFPGEGGHDAEGAACLWCMDESWCRCYNSRDVRRPSPTCVLSMIVHKDVAVFNPLSHLR